MRECPRCHTMRPQEEYLGKNKRGEPIGYCKQCRAEYSAEYSRGRKRDRPKRNVYEQARYQENRLVSAFLRKEKDRRLQKTVGITLEDYEKMLDEINGHCQVCGRQAGRIVIDHDHKTGKFRGLVCNSCNVGMGMFEDDPMRFALAMVYLQRHTPKL